MTDPFKEALEDFDQNMQCRHILHPDTVAAISLSLRIASRLQQEPSEAMIELAHDIFTPNIPYIPYNLLADAYNQLTQQLMKECEE